MPELDVNELRPTLVIGLGGTGKLILTRLRSYLQQRLPDTPSVADPWKRRIRLLELDIDPALEVVATDSRQIVLQEDESVDCGSTPAAEVLKLTLDNAYPDLETWLDTSLSLAERDLRRGGQQIRQLGRLSLFWHLGRGSSLYLYKRFKDTIEDLLNQYTIDPTRPIALTIYVISSLCGGTGSGMFIDIAYILRQILGSRQRFTQIQGIFAMPSFYRSAPQFPLQGNTWASLKELDYFMTAPAAERRYPEISYLPGLDTQRIPCTEKPFDLVYLIDSKTEEGTNVTSAEAMAQLLMNALGLLTASRVGDEAASKINNVAALRDIAAGTVYSSLGVASLVFPAEQVNIWCAAAELQDFVKGTLLVPLEQTKTNIEHLEGGATTGETKRSTPESEAKDFLSIRKWTTEGFKSSLMLDTEKKSIVPRVTSDERLRPGVINNLSKDTMFDTIKDRAIRALPELVARAEVSIGDAEANTGLRSAVAAQFANGLQDQLSAIVNDKERGVEFALAFLNYLTTALKDLKSDVDKSLDIAKGSLTSAETAMANSEAEFKKRALRSSGWFRQDSKPARDAYLRTVQTSVDRTVECKVWEEAQKLVIEAQKSVDVRRQRLQGAKDALMKKTLNYLLERKQKAFAEIVKMDRLRNRPILLGPVGKEVEVLRENLQEILQTYRGPAMETLKNKLYGRDALLYTLLLGATSAEEKLYGPQGQLIAQLQGTESLEEKLLAWGRKAFEKVYDIHLESQIEKMAHKQNQSPNEYLTQTFQNASYLWSTKQAGAVAQGRFKQVVTVIGLEDRETSLYGGTATAILAPVVSAEGTTIISSGDPHRLTILKMGHGLRFLDYDWSADYVGSYQKHIEGLKPIHIFPEFNLNLLGRGKDARLFFALALAYGILIKDRARSYVLTPEGTREQTLLSNERGMFDAMWTVVHDDRLVQNLCRRVQGYEREKRGSVRDRRGTRARRERGKEVLIEQLTSFTEEFKVPPDDKWLVEILQNDVRRYLKEVAEYF